MKPVLKVLAGQAVERPPIWIMRQAGRYLPEYRELRASAGGFLDMVYSPDKAAEVTMQPIRRYGMDGAILFSDILITPHGLGQPLQFIEGRGPVLEPIRSLEALDALDAKKDFSRFDSVAETVAMLSRQLPEEGFAQTTLIGFAGSPWTVACYMVEGGGSKEFHHVKHWAMSDPESFDALIDRVAETTITYLGKQIEAGAEAVQLFDSWAGILDETLFERFVITPTVKITLAIKRNYPGIPIIGFPRGAGPLYHTYADTAGVDALGLDFCVPLSLAKELQKKMPVQGNLDPAYLLGDGRAALEKADDILKALDNGPHIFNLGHGISKNTKPEAVESLVGHVRGK